MQTEETKRMDYDLLREKLASKQGPEFWKGLEQIAETEEFTQWMADEFPNRSTLDQIDRRSILKFMGASMLLAGLAGCRAQVWPNPKIVPYVVQPEEIVPGKPLLFSSMMPLDGFAYPVVVESHMGRPTKLDGNGESGTGPSTVLMQASLLNLYDPDRSRTAMHLNATSASDWDHLGQECIPILRKLAEEKGAGIAFLMSPTSSPTMLKQVQKAQTKWPLAKFVFWSPNSRDAAYRGTQAVFGKPAEAVYSLENAKVILSIDADFIGSGPSQLKNAQGWAAGRQAVDGDPTTMSRVYALEMTPGLAGAVADHKLPVSSVELEQFVRALAGAVGVPGAIGNVTGELGKWVNVLASELRNSGVVVAGEFVSSAIHALVAAINQVIGATTSGAVRYVPTKIARAGSHISDLQALIGDMQAGKVKFLAILGGNPALTAPADFGFQEALQKVQTSVYLSHVVDDTSKLTTWHGPQSHYLESWGDGFTQDGKLAIQQPLISPLYDSKSDLEALAFLMEDVASAYDLVRAEWKASGLLGADFAKGWRKALSVGTTPTSPAALAVNLGAIASLPDSRRSSGEVDVLLRPDPTIHDGLFVNNGWLQEMPKPLTTLTWDNVILVSPKKAAELGVGSGDHVRVELEGKAVEGPCWVMSGQGEQVVTVFYGYGSNQEGYIARGTGFNAFPILTSSALMGPVGGSIKKVGGHTRLAATQLHHSMEGRDIIKTATVEEFLHPHEGEHGHHKEMSMYDGKEHVNELQQWGMTIDLNVCTGCHACVAACQAENNIAVVGKQQVLVGREMHWIRIDRYYGPKTAEGSRELDNPSTHFMPVACMHCEQAPCEPVCPVAATIHSSEGLNQMVYNRCVGTRYCSNNCPYKVRRFNFLNYADRKYTEYPEYRDLRSLTLARNPDVTVRGRGVMEKCTFCVQRINEARQTAKVEFSKGQREKAIVRDGEITTACEAACPTRAITFGDIRDPESAVSKAKAKKRNYDLLPELNTRNRLTYLHMVKNPNKELETV